MTDISIQKGSTFSYTLRWEAPPFIYKPITAITKAAPVSITASSHGFVDGWRVAVQSVLGMREINAKNKPPRATDFHKLTYVDANTIALNDTDSSGFTAYTSGGYLVGYTPINMAGFTARMQIRSTAEATGVPLLELTTENGRIAIDNTARTITLTVSATDTAALTFSAGVYDLELVSGDATPVVTKLLSGNIAVADEVTR